MSDIDQFLSAMEAAGLAPRDAIHADGKPHRFSPTGKRGDAAGCYVLHLGGVPVGVFCDWRSGEVQRWCAKAEDELSEAERQAVRGRIKDAQSMCGTEEARMHGESVPSAMAVSEDAEGVKPHGVGTDTERQ